MSSATLVTFSNQCETPQSTLPSGPRMLAHRLMSTSLQGSASSLAHHPMSSSDTICNKLNPTTSRYCPPCAFPSRLPKNKFALSLPDFQKTSLLGRSFHTLIKNVSFSFPTDLRSHKTIVFHPRRHKDHA